MKGVRSRRLIGVLLVGVVVSAALAEVTSNPAQPLLEATPGLRALMVGDRTAALYRVPISANTTAAATDNFVTNFVQQNASALGVAPGDLVFRDAATIRNGTLRVYTYTQRIEGLPVDGSLLKLPVSMGPPERIAHVALRLVQRPTALLPGD